MKHLWILTGTIGMGIGLVFFIFQQSSLNFGQDLLWNWPWYKGMGILPVGLLHTATYGLLGVAVGLIITKFRD